MKFIDSLKERPVEDLWQEYCGFLKLSMDEYMRIQTRLMEEQISLWSRSGIGQRFLKGEFPQSISEFRSAVPLTTYQDYAGDLLKRRDENLPARASIWIETTWEGGTHPVKAAPYTDGMIETIIRNFTSILLLASSTGEKQYRLGNRVYSGLAPVPYLTGLLGLIADKKFGFDFMPPRETTETMSFGSRSKLGFSMAMGEGMDYFLGMGSVSYYISKLLMQKLEQSGGGKRKNRMNAAALFRVARAKLRAKKENRGLLPKDLFDLKGFVVAGTDNACYKDDLEKMWGVRPIEIFAGTECSLIGTETWNKNDLYFFPDTCFYEFLPEQFVRKEDRFLPTLTMDEVRPNEVYELVITVFKGGVFARYRTGDLYCCTGTGSREDESALPHFKYVDRAPQMIDIAGFTRISGNSIRECIRLTRLPIRDWCALKEFEEGTGHPYLHMYIELKKEALPDQAVTEELFRKNLEAYFSYLDEDYESLKSILGMEPLKITFLQSGTFDLFREKLGRPIEAMQPQRSDISILLKLQEEVGLLRTPGSYEL